MSVNMANKTYDRLKHVVTVVLPAAGSLYFGLSQIWNLPAGEEVVGTLSLFTVFGGVVLGISSKNYAEDVDGDFVIERRANGERLVQFQLDKEPEDVIDKDRIVFNVVDSDRRFWDPVDDAE